MSLLLSNEYAGTNHAGTPKHNIIYNKHDKLGYNSICIIGSKFKYVSIKEVYKL